MDIKNVTEIDRSMLIFE